MDAYFLHITKNYIIMTTVGGSLFDFFQGFGKLPDKNEGAADGRRGVGDSFCGIYSRNFHEMWQDERQGNQQNDLSQQGDEYGYFGLSQGDKHVLTGTLETEDGHSSQKYGHRTTDGFNELRVAGKDGGNQGREQNHEGDQQEVEEEHDGKYNLEAFLDARDTAVSVVVADNGDKALGKTGEGNTDDEHGALHDGQGTDVDVSECLQAAVEDEAYQAFCAGHDEGRDAQCQYGENDSFMGFHVFAFQGQGGTW